VGIEVIQNSTQESNIFLEGDALDLIKLLPDKHFSLIVSSPPYNIGKIYERDRKLTLKQYILWQRAIATELVKKLRDDGSVCWQVGSYIKNGVIYPLDFAFYHIFSDLGLKLRNRIIWKFNFGLNADKRFSGRYETVLWFTKTNEYKFNLDPVRIPQLYPGKRHSSQHAAKAGLPSGNPKGKNPSDYWEFSAEKDFIDNPVWDIPNVKANHPEKTEHPCQFPIELVERCILAFTDKGDAILDPFVGTGASVIAAIKHKRCAIGIDKDATFLEIARRRVVKFQNGELRIRPIGKPIRRPRPTEKVAKTPEEWGHEAVRTSKKTRGGIYD
jgi:DNA modification methylase